MLIMAPDTLPGMAMQKAQKARQRGEILAPQADMDKPGWEIVYFQSRDEASAANNLNRQVKDPKNKYNPSIDILVRHTSDTSNDTLNFARVRFSPKT